MVHLMSPIEATIGWLGSGWMSALNMVVNTEKERIYNQIFSLRLYSRKQNVEPYQSDVIHTEGQSTKGYMVKRTLVLSGYKLFVSFLIAPILW